jgi:general secretion pathway protein A
LTSEGRNIPPWGEAGPFDPVVNPGFYVPRPACELVLDSLQSALRGGSLAVALAGPAGAGKLMVLRILEQRLRSAFRIVFVSRCALSSTQLAQQVLRALPHEGPGDPERALLAAALRYEAEGRPLVLILERASEIPGETAQRLAALLAEGEGALRCVVRVDDEAARETTRTLSPDLVEVPLRAPMSEAESIRFVRERLARARVSDDVRLRFYDHLIARLHQAAEGVPGALNRLAARVAAGNPPPEAAPEPLPAPAERRLDPFGPSAATGAYQPRSATEELIMRLHDRLVGGGRSLVLHGPPGLGKTTILRVLRERLPTPFQTVEIPYGLLDPDDFWSYVLFQLGAPRGPFPEGELLEVVRRLERVGEVLVLLVDEAHALPDATRSRLAALLHHADGALRAVLAVDAGLDPNAFSELPDAEWIALERPLSEPETAAYVTGRLERFDAPRDVRARFDEGTLATLFRASRGVPRELNRLAGEIERDAGLRELRDPPAEKPPTPPVESLQEPEPERAGHRPVEPEPGHAEDELPAPEARPTPIGSLKLEPGPDAATRPQTDPSPAAEDVAPPLDAVPAAARMSDAPAAELQRISEVKAAADARRRLSAPPVGGPRRAVEEPGKRPTRQAGPAEKPERRAHTGVLPHVALGVGVPLVLLLLWLWLTPVFTAGDLPLPAPPPQEVRVHINATPWARVEVDGRPLGVTPLGNVPLSPGQHAFRAELPDGRVLERLVDVSETRRHVAFE